MKANVTISDLGEKEIIRSIIKPLLNPFNDPYLPGDDCAIIDIKDYKYLSITTDRVPADLISFKLGLIDYNKLGYYLAVLNISDIVSSGAIPFGLVLTFAFPNDFLIADLKQILLGVKEACEKYNCKIYGGDLSHSIEMSISATAIGFHKQENMLFRVKSKNDDYIYCTDYIGLTSTAFYYFLKAKPSGLVLEKEDETILINQFSQPKPKPIHSKILSSISLNVTCMDNTDGFGQSLMELSELNNKKYVLDTTKLPIHKISYKIADYLQMDVIDLVLDGGADFQLIGTVSSDQIETLSFSEEKFYLVGTVQEGSGLWFLKENNLYKYSKKGWDYFGSKINALSCK